MFSTSLATLTRYPDSYFGAMFSKQWNSKPGADGSYFIDKNPQVFHIILDYLRGEELDLELTPSEKRALLRDAQFYQLPDLVAILKPLDPPKESNTLWELTPSPNGTLSNNNRTFQKIGSVDWECNVLGSVGWSSGVHQWSVVLGNHLSEVTIGVSPNTTNRGGRNHYSKGFSLYCTKGTLYGQDGSFNRAYCQPYTTAGTRITVKLDMDARTLRFAINGAWQPIAWNNLPSITFYPSFDVGSPSTIFTVIPE